MQRERSTRNRIVFAIGLLLTLGSLLLRANQWGERYLGLTALQSRDLFWWPVLFLILFYIIAVERLPLSSIGFKRPSWKTLVFGAGTAAFLFALDPVIDMAMSLFHANPKAGAETAHGLSVLPYWYRVVLVIRAAVAEEVFFRGYAIERIEALTGSTALAVIVSAVLFGFAHMAYWGWEPAVGVGIGGLVFAMLYVWRRDLWANIFAHFLVDAISLLL